jgi:hypothetical protein
MMSTGCRHVCWRPHSGARTPHVTGDVATLAAMTDSADALVFTVSASGAPGVSRKRSRGPSFSRPSRGVRVSVGADADLLARADLVGCRSDAVLCDVAAARLWGLPLPPWIEFGRRDTSVAVAPGTAEPRRTGVHGRRLRLPAFHVTEVEGVRVTVPARTWMDCAALIPFDHLVAMGDAILHRGLCDAGALQHLSQWGYRRRGIVAVRGALRLLDAGAESPGESLARVMLLEGGVPRPVCNLDVFAGSRWLARVDMAWPTQRVIVEYDGRVHLEERQRRRDAERLNALQSAGWRVIVLTADDLRRASATCSMVNAALRSTR